MTLLQLRRSLRISQFKSVVAAASASWLVACSSPAASNPTVASPSSVPASRQVAVAESSADTIPSNGTTSQTQSVDSVDLVVKRELWPLKPASAEELLQGLGQVRRETPIPRALSLVGGPTASVARFEVSYSQDEDGHWTFNAATFFLGDADLPRLYRRLQTRITERLGKPEWTEKQNDLPSSGWSLGRDMSLLLAPSPNQGERLVMLSISEPEGEAE
jgi:hypothetical protein